VFLVLGLGLGAATLGSVAPLRPMGK